MWLGGRERHSNISPVFTGSLRNFSIVFNDDQLANLQKLVLLHLPQSLTDLVGDALWSEMPETYLQWMMAKSLAARIVYREGFEYLEAMEDEHLARLAMRYLELEQERASLIEEILSSDMHYKERVATLLQDAGIFSTMGHKEQS